MGLLEKTDCGVRNADSQLKQALRFPPGGKDKVWKTRSPKKKSITLK